MLATSCPSMSSPPFCRGWLLIDADCCLLVAVVVHVEPYEVLHYKTADNSFSLWPVRTRFGHVVRMCILYADFGDDFPDLEVMQVLDNNITCTFFIAFLPNVWKQTQNIVNFAANFVQRMVLAVARAICGAWMQNFGIIQVYFIVKSICNSILHNYNIKPCPNFCKHTEIRPIVHNTHMQIDWKWCSGWCLGTEICGREGIYAYNIIMQHNLPDCIHKISTPLALITHVKFNSKM